MKKSNKYSAAIFDLDGLILDTEKIGQIAWNRAAADLGIELADEVYDKLIGVVIRDGDETLRSAFGTDFPVAQMRRRAEQYFDEYINEHGLETKPGFLELLAFVKKNKLLTAVATSTAKVLAMQMLNVCNLVNKFDVIVCGDEIQNGKPAPDIFLKAAKRLGTAPEQCMVFEDSENGVRAAHTAGMTTILIPDLLKPSEKTTQLADRVFSTLDEVIPYLQELLGNPSDPV